METEEAFPCPSCSCSAVLGTGSKGEKTRGEGRGTALCEDSGAHSLTHTNFHPQNGPDYIFPNKWLSHRLLVQLCIIDWPSPGCAADGWGWGADGAGVGGGGVGGCLGAQRLNRNQQSPSQLQLSVKRGGLITSLFRGAQS